MIAFPIEIAELMRTKILCEASTRVTLGLSHTDDSFDNTPVFNDEYSRQHAAHLFLRDENAANESWGRGQALINSAVTRLRGVVYEEGVREEARGYFVSGSDALLGAVIINGYSAFESLAEDLWIEGLNECQMAARQWIAKNLDKAAKFGELFGGGLDLTKIFGTRISQVRQVNFSTFSDIEKNYLHAYGTAIMDNFNHPRMYATEKMRHLLAHRAGVIDAKFIREVKSIPDLADLELGSNLPMSGLVVRGSIDACVSAAVSLLTYVDEFTVTNHD